MTTKDDVQTTFDTDFELISEELEVDPFDNI